MKKHALIIVMVMVITSKFYSQVQPRSFMTTTEHLIGLPNPILNAIPNGAPASRAFNAAYRTDGSLWFYVIDNKLFNMAGDEIYELFNPTSDPCSGLGLNSNGVDRSTEIPIIPKPGSTSEFYIIYPGAYVIYDACANVAYCQQLPGFHTQRIQQTQALQYRHNFAVTPIINPAGERFLIAADDNNFLNVYSVSSSGISNVFNQNMQNMILTIYSASINYDDESKTEMECFVDFSTNKLRIALPLALSNGLCGQGGWWRYEIFIFELDFNQSMNVSFNQGKFVWIELPDQDAYNPCSNNKAIPKGLEFSPDGRILYFTQSKPDGVSNAHALYYYDGTGVYPLFPTGATFFNENDFQFSMIEFGFDWDNLTNPQNQKLYFVSGNRIASLSDPNNPDPANWNDLAINASSFLCHQGSQGSNNLSDNIYVLPDQIDLEDYSITASLYTCCNQFDNEFTYWGPGTYSGSFNLNSDLIIPSGANVVFDNLIMDIAANVKIVIMPGASLEIRNGSKLYACNNMWQGIELTNSTSTLIMNNDCYVADALEAVKALYAGNINITRSWFDKNYIGLLLRDNGTQINAYVADNLFTCSGGNSLKFPHLNERTHKQIFLLTASQITIGDPLLGTNSFTGADYGIFAERTFDFNLYNNFFYDFTYQADDKLGVPVYLKNCQKVNIGNKSMGITNTFSNIENFGIIVAGNTHVPQGGDIIISNNQFDAVAGACLALANSHPLSPVEFSDNTVDNAYFGYGGFLNTSSQRIMRNNINILDDNSIYFNSNNAGIFISNWSWPLNNPAPSKIHDNVIRLLGDVGINLSNTSQFNIFQNHVYMDQNIGPATVKRPLFGFRSEFVQSSEWTCNRVDNNFSPNRKTAFGFFDTFRCTMKCNIGYSTLNGIKFTGNSSSNQVLGNTMDGHSYAFILGETGIPVTTFIDDMTLYNGELPGNLWFSNTWDTYNNGTTPAPQYWTATTAGPDVPLNNYGSLAYPAINPTQQLLFNLFDCSSSQPCNIPMIVHNEGDSASSFSLQLAQQIAQNSLPALSQDAIAQWKAQKALYESLRSNQAMLNDPVLQQFYDSASFENIGLLTDVSQLMALTTDAAVMSDSMLLAGVINDALAMNSAIVPGMITEFNEKVINEVYLNSFAIGRYKLTTAELGDAMMVAMQCIYDGGPAVAAARALVHSQYPFTMFNDEELCTGSAYRQSVLSYNKKEKQMEGSFAFPNPAKDKLTISFFEKKQGKILIRDITGRLVKSITIKENTYSIAVDISDLSAGSYLYQFSDGNIQGRFEIVK
jgi:hypothetical protein